MAGKSAGMQPQGRLRRTPRTEAVWSSARRRPPELPVDGIRCDELGIFLHPWRACSRELWPFSPGWRAVRSNRAFLRRGRSPSRGASVRSPCRRRRVVAAGAQPTRSCCSILFRLLIRPVQAPVTRGRSYCKSVGVRGACTTPGARINCSSHQFTNRRIRIFMTIPSARNVNKTEEPP